MVNIDETIIARLESYGEKFEILVDPDLAADFRNPDNEKEINIEDILAVEEIFKDSKKGDKINEKGIRHHRRAGSCRADSSKGKYSNNCRAKKTDAGG